MVNVFQFSSQLQILYWKHPNDSSLTSWKQAPKQIFKDIASGDLKLQPFFLPLCSPVTAIPTGTATISFRPFVDQLQFPNQLQTSSSKISSKSFRQACPSTYVAPAHLARIQLSAWNFFWCLSLTMIQRNVIYRLINHCILHQALLHRNFLKRSLVPFLRHLFICY